MLLCSFRISPQNPIEPDTAQICRSNSADRTPNTGRMMLQTCAVVNGCADGGPVLLVAEEAIRGLQFSIIECLGKALAGSVSEPIGQQAQSPIQSLIAQRRIAQLRGDRTDTLGAHAVHARIGSQPGSQRKMCRTVRGLPTHHRRVTLSETGSAATVHGRRRIAGASAAARSP